MIEMMRVAKNVFLVFFIKVKSKIDSIRLKNFHRKVPTVHPTSGVGRIGIGDRCCIMGGWNNILIGSHSWIKEQAELITYCDGKIRIGSNVGILPRIRITCINEVRIGDNVLIAPEVFITDHNHGMNPEILTGYSSQPLIVKKVMIEDGVWLGQRVCVLPGVTIGEHSIIGAGSVVTKDIPPYSIAVGSPARVIKQWNFQSGCWERV